jgi:hypothetical protein
MDIQIENRVNNKINFYQHDHEQLWKNVEGGIRQMEIFYSKFHVIEEITGCIAHSWFHLIALMNLRNCNAILSSPCKYEMIKTRTQKRALPFFNNATNCSSYFRSSNFFIILIFLKYHWYHHHHHHLSLYGKTINFFIPNLIWMRMWNGYNNFFGIFLSSSKNVYGQWSWENNPKLVKWN